MADRAYQLPPQPLRYRWETAGRWQIERTSYHQPLVTVLSFLQSWSIRLRGVIADSLSLTTQRNRGFSPFMISGTIMGNILDVDPVPPY